MSSSPSVNSCTPMMLSLVGTKAYWAFSHFTCGPQFSQQPGSNDAKWASQGPRHHSARTRSPQPLQRLGTWACPHDSTSGGSWGINRLSWDYGTQLLSQHPAGTPIQSTQQHRVSFSRTHTLLSETEFGALPHTWQQWSGCQHCGQKLIAFQLPAGRKA